MKQKAISKYFPSQKFGILLLCVICVALVYAIFASKENFQSLSMKDLRGVWKTSHPQYEDRFLQFDDQTITFGWGDAGVASYTLKDMHCDPQKAGILVQMQYVDNASTEFQFSFYYVDLKGGMIRMKSNKKIHWYRISDQPVHDPEFK